MKNKFIVIAAAAAIALSIPAMGQGSLPIEPDGTYMFAQRDTCELYLDVYNPAPDSETSYKGKAKPTVLFVFGGGFISGSRDSAGYLPWYRELTQNGYRVIAIDYRLGLKGVRSMGVAQVNLLDNAIHLAVEDLVSATAFILENADALGVDPAGIVLSGSSAGAITILQAEYELCNRASWTQSLPEDFRYAGLMPFAGAILSRDGKLKFDRETSPIAMFHGTADKLVNYKQTAFMKLGFFGSDKIAERLAKYGCTYTIYRYPGHGHEIADIMGRTVSLQDTFIKENVMADKKTVMDVTITDPSIPTGRLQTPKDLYGN